MGGGAAAGLALLLVGVATAAAAGADCVEGLANVTTDPSVCNQWVGLPGGWPSFDDRGNLRADSDVWVPVSGAGQSSAELRELSDPDNDFVAGTSAWWSPARGWLPLFPPRHPLSPGREPPLTGPPRAQTPCSSCWRPCATARSTAWTKSSRRWARSLARKG